MRGRKAKYDYTDKFFLLEVEGLARDGITDRGIAKKLGMNGTYFSEVKKKYSEISEALTRGRQPLNVIVENALYKRAVGMKVKTTTKRYILKPDGTQSDDELVQETETEVPPEPKAIAMWLTQRKPEVWNKQPQKVDVTTGGKSFLELIQKATSNNEPGESSDTAED